MKLKILIISFLAVLFSFTAAFGSVSVVLSDQMPDPVSPGNFVYLNIKVTNAGDSPIPEAQITMEDNEHFKLAAGETRTKNLGAIPQNTRIASSTGFVIAKYRVLVAEDAPLGLNKVNFRLDSSVGTFNYNFDVLVMAQNPRIQVNNFEVNEAIPGQISTLKIEIENINTIPLRDVFVSLNLNDVEDKPFGLVSGTNQRAIALIMPGEKREIEFKLLVGPDARSRPYLVPVDITFEDSQNNLYQKIVQGSVNVYSEPIIDLRLSSQDIYSEGRGRITLAISNPGTSVVKGTRLEILDSEGYEILDGQFQYVGDLNPDDFQTLQFDTFIKSQIDSLQARLIYLDSYNNEIVKEIDVPIRTYSKEELNRLGLRGSSGSGPGLLTYIVVLILVGAAFFIGRKFGYKKAKKSKN